MESETEDSSIDSSELATSDVPVSDINILQPDYVRSKLLEIANQKFQKKRRKKVCDGNFMTEIVTAANYEEY